MEAIVLAGGLGRRLREVVPGLPKTMAPVAGRPFLEIVLTLLAKKGFSRVVLSLGYKAETITTYFGSRYRDLELVYEIEHVPLGTGGAVRAAMEHCVNDHIYIFNGDTYLDLEVDEVEMLWERHHLPIIVVHQIPDTSRYGRVKIEEGKVISFVEKGVRGPGLINAGSYVLQRDALNQYMVGEKFSMEKDYLAQEIKQHPFNAFVARGQFVDIGVPDDYARAQRELSICFL